MGRWTPDEHGCIYDETGCFARLTPNKAERLASRHNADIDALTAERDAWRNAVIDAAVVNWTYTAEDENDPYRAVCKLLGCAAREALDPQISLEAKALHDRIAELEAECDNANAYATWVDGLTIELTTATAERDELQRRLDAVVGMLEPLPDEKYQKLRYAEDIDHEDFCRKHHARALAIAEGWEG